MPSSAVSAGHKWCSADMNSVADGVYHSSGNKSVKQAPDN